jgi:hypothetical protein
MNIKPKWRKKTMSDKSDETSDLAAFEEQLKNVGQQVVPPGVANMPPGNNKTVQIKKNLVISYVSDFAGCGHIRNVFPMTFLNSVFGKSSELINIVSPIWLWQQDLLMRARTLYFQRQMTPQHLELLTKYKELQGQFKYKMVWDIDDFIWGHNEKQGGTVDDGVPSYNFGWNNITDEVKESSVKIMNLMDTCLFSTQFLADYAKDVLGVTAECKVLPNAIPMFFWGNKMKSDIKEPIEKPRVLYTGSPTHYHNGEKLLGDWENAWKEWVIKSVNNDEIDFIVMGGLPWFFEEIQDKIKIVPWVDSFRYHTAVKEQNAHFGIMPLVPNNFNHGKSDIKAIEHWADGVVSIGTTFTNGKPSPYDNNPMTLPDNCTVDDIDAMFNDLKQPNNFNKIKNDQYRKLNEDARFIEHPEYVKYLTSLI